MFDAVGHDILLGFLFSYCVPGVLSDGGAIYDTYTVTFSNLYKLYLIQA